MKQSNVTEQVVEITQAVRQLFHQLKAIGTALHTDIGVTVPMRGVLETLHRGGANTVPRMARMRPVSRQHLQRIVDELLERDLVGLEKNPDHKRSSLVSLTEKGRALYLQMAERESKIFRELSRGLSPSEVAATHKVLDQLTARLKEMIGKQTQAEGENGDDDN